MLTNAFNICMVNSIHCNKIKLQNVEIYVEYNINVFNYKSPGFVNCVLFWVTPDDQTVSNVVYDVNFMVFFPPHKYFAHGLDRKILLECIHWLRITAQSGFLHIVHK